MCANGAYVREAHVHEVYVHEVYVHEVYVHEVYVHEVYVHEVCVREVCVREVCVHEVYVTARRSCEPPSVTCAFGTGDSSLTEGAISVLSLVQRRFAGRRGAVPYEVRWSG